MGKIPAPLDKADEPYTDAGVDGLFLSPALRVCVTNNKDKFSTAVGARGITSARCTQGTSLHNRNVPGTGTIISYSKL